MCRYARLCASYHRANENCKSLYVGLDRPTPSDTAFCVAASAYSLSADEPGRTATIGEARRETKAESTSESLNRQVLRKRSAPETGCAGMRPSRCPLLNHAQRHSRMGGDNVGIDERFVLFGRHKIFLHCFERMLSCQVFSGIHRAHPVARFLTLSGVLRLVGPQWLLPSILRTPVKRKDFFEIGREIR